MELGQVNEGTDVTMDKIVLNERNNDDEEELKTLTEAIDSKDTVLEEKDVDEFLDAVGQFGMSQKLLLLLFCLIIIVPTYQALIMSFVGSSPGWRCVSNHTACNDTISVFKRGHDNYDDNCDMPRDAWTFVKDTDYSIVTEWELVCKKKGHTYLASSAMYIGWAVGAIVLGMVSDRYGRKSVLFPSYTCMIVFSFVSGVIPSFWIFFILRLFIGVCQGGIGLTLFVMATELVGPKYRSLTGNTIWLAFTFALCIMGLQAWLMPHWRILEMVTSAPYLVLLVTYKFIPESIRWLRVNKKLEKAEKILRKIAKTNKKPWPSAKLSQCANTSGEKSSFRDLFSTRVMLIRTLTLCFAWFVNGQVYYGISLASDNLGGDPYRDFVLTSLVEVPANLLIIYVSNKYGRKPTTIVGMAIGGISCLGTSFIPSDTQSPKYIWSRVSLGMLGKFCITVSFNCIYIWAVELCPTVIRAQSMALVLVFSRIGAASAPWVAQFLGHFSKILPFALMGVLAVVAAVLLCVLPETLGQATAETLEDTLKDIGTRANTLEMEPHEFKFRTSIVV